MRDGGVATGAERCRGGRLVALMMTTALAAGTPGLTAWAQDRQAEASTAAQAEQRRFDIPAQPLTEALIQFGRQSGLQASADAGLVRTLRSAPVQGVMTWRQALAQLLAGTGLVYRLSGSMITVSRPGGADAGTGGRDDRLILAPVRVSAPDRADPADVPFSTPGSSAYISAERIRRVAPTSPGDIFREVPGVLSGNNHNSKAIDINIRGVQGHNRVKVMVEGTQQESSVYRGYAGPDNRSHIDPELIGGIEIGKGPGGGPYGTGTTGGVVNVRTLGAADLVADGREAGFRVRGGLGGNAVAPRPLETPVWRPRDADTGLLEESNDLLSEDNWFASFAGAYRTDHLELVGAYAVRTQGNYFAGRNGPETYEWTYFRSPDETTTTTGEYSRIKPGGEVPNTSEDTASALLKATGRLDGGHSLELGFLRYDSTHGYVFPSALNRNPVQQYRLREVDSSRYWGRYKWASASDLIDLEANVWGSQSGERLKDNDKRFLDTESWGIEAWNTSRVFTPLGDLAVTYGGSYTASTLTMSQGDTADGTRRVAGGYVDAALAPTDWLTINTGVRYDTFDSDGFSIERVCDWLQVPPCEMVKREGALSDDALSPRAGITVSPLDGVQLFVQYSKGFRPPSIVETSGAGPSAAIYLNPELKPERLTSWEAGVNLLRDGLVRPDDAFRAKLVYFDNQHDDYIVRGFDFQFINLPQANIEGVELSASYDAGVVFADVSFNYFTSVEYCYAIQWPFQDEVEDCFAHPYPTDWQNSYGQPEYAGSATLGARLLDRALELGTRVTFHGEPAFPLPDWPGVNFPVRWAAEEIVDVFGSYAFNRHVSAHVSVENLTDRFYVSPLAVAKIPSPGRTVRASLTLTF